MKSVVGVALCEFFFVSKSARGLIDCFLSVSTKANYFFVCFESDLVVFRRKISFFSRMNISDRKSSLGKQRVFSEF